MQTGIFLGQDGSYDGTFEDLVSQAIEIESRGFGRIWVGDSFGFDALSLLAAIGSRTSRVTLSTAIVPIQTRHPAAMAREARTVSLACGGRFELGVGMSHRFVVERVLGGSYRKPVSRMREYLGILRGLLNDDVVSMAGEFFRTNQLKLESMPPANIPINVAALRPAMLQLAADLELGTVTFMTGPRTLERRIVPSGVPRVAAMFPVLLSNDVNRARAFIDRALAIYGQTPGYRAMLNEESQAGPGDNALVGSEDQLTREIDRLREVGVTQFVAAIVAPDSESYSRTFEFLASTLKHAIEA